MEQFPREWHYVICDISKYKTGELEQVGWYTDKTLTTKHLMKRRLTTKRLMRGRGTFSETDLRAQRERGRERGKLSKRLE